MCAAYAACFACEGSSLGTRLDPALDYFLTLSDPTTRDPMPLISGNASDFPAASHCSNSPTVGGNNHPKSYYRRGMVRNPIALNNIFKNPISCPLLLNVAASSDRIVQTAKPAKMKQLHAVAAVLLLFPNFGLTQLPPLVSLHIQAKDVTTSPDRLLAVEDDAFDLIDGMCGQVPVGSPADYTVSGAFNMQTGVFMTWNEYIHSVGRYHGNPQFHWAFGSWHTFTGTCSLKPASAWIEPSYRSHGVWAVQYGNTAASGEQI